MRYSIFAFLILVARPAFSAEVENRRCFFIASYHQGYEWQDGIENALKEGLKGSCELRQFYMDTKRNEQPEFAVKMALAAKEEIEKWNPDVIIAADDNATKYIIHPYFKNSKIPVVFCGLNWTVTEYGLPYKNTTGMIEVNAVSPFYIQLKSILPLAKKGVCLGADNETDTKVCERFRIEGLKNNFSVETALVKNMKQWSISYKEAQDKFDFVILSNNAGIKDWNDQDAQKWIEDTTQKFSFAVHEWTAKFALFSMTSLAKEQGDFAAEAAVSILNGKSPNQIPIISNSKWQVLMNKKLIDKIGLKMPKNILEKARDVSEN